MREAWWPSEVKALLLSAYAAQSHRYWQRGLGEMFPQWQWTELELPPRHFSWRVRGNPLVWSVAQRDVLESGYDVLVATSMVDLATLRGLVPALASVPTLLYFHENQFHYPQDRQQHSLLEAQMVSLYSALAADRLAFNSAYNRDTFFQGLEQLLSRLPDQVPPGVVASLQAKTRVLPVPLLEDAPAVSAGNWPGVQGLYPQRPLRLLWSARFEHDKGGEGLYRILEALESSSLDYELALTGQQFRNSPPVFERIAQEFGHRLVQFGFVESDDLFRTLQMEADIVLSTAEHEFQGLAVLEAVHYGCLPVVPDRLAYRELYAPAWRYRSCPQEPEEETQCAVELIANLARSMSNGVHSAPDVSAFLQPSLAHEYRTEFARLSSAAG